MTHIMTGWRTDLTLWSWGCACVSLFAHNTLKLHGQGQQTGVQGLPALYTTDPKNIQRRRGLFSTTHLLQVMANARQEQTGTIHQPQPAGM